MFRLAFVVLVIVAGLSICAAKPQIYSDGCNTITITGQIPVVVQQPARPSGGLLGGLINAAGNLAGGVINTAGNIAGGVANAAGNLAGGVINTAGNIAGGVANAAGNLAGTAINAAGHVANAATGGLLGGIFG